MRLYSLNLWGGKLFEPLLEHIRSQSSEMDIFCFQEVFGTSTEEKEYAGYRANLFQELQNALPDFNSFYGPALENINMLGEPKQGLSFGLAAFVRKNIRIEEVDEVFIYKEKGRGGSSAETNPRNLQSISFNADGSQYLIAHFHGLYRKKGKVDTEERMVQSQKVMEFLDKKEGKKILCGDFNLLPETESLKILEKKLINLVKTHQIETTRSVHYTKPVKHADYLLVSDDIDVKDFKVPKVEVSDHLPLILEFS